jgi:hypothetical protein
VLELERLELEGSYRMEGRGGGAWAWIGADTINSKVIFKTCLSLCSELIKYSPAASIPTPVICSFI